MDKRLSGLAALLILAGIIGGIMLFRGDATEASNQPSNTVTAPAMVDTTSATSRASASPIPGASPIAGESDCTGIQAWTERVQERFAETDAIAAKVQDKDDLAALSIEDLTRMVSLLEAGLAAQQADVPPSAGAEVHQALLALIQIETDFFTATLDAKSNGGDIGAVYDAHVTDMQTAAGGVSILAMTLAFTCFDAFE